MGYNNSTTTLIKKFFCFTFSILLFDRIDTVPAALFSPLRKIKYLYIIFVALYVWSQISKHGFKKKEVSALIVILIFFIHTFLWGVVFVNTNLIKETHVHMREMVILLLFIGLTALLYSRGSTDVEFAKHSYFCYLAALVWAGVTHPSSFVNPIKFVYVLGGEHTYRVSFGMGHANYVGSICCCALTCSIYLFEKIRKHRSLKELLQNKQALLLIITDIYIGEMLFSTASRTAILAFSAEFILYFLINSNELFPVYGVRNVRFLVVVIGGIFLFIAGALGIFTELMETSHRDALIDTNWEILVNYFSIWTGMGYINYSGFAFGAWEFGYQTVNTDSYYAYIFFSTGILGSIFIVASLLITCVESFKNSYKRKNICGFVAVISFLLIGIAQASILSYDHMSSYTYWILLLIGMSYSCFSVY